MPKVSQSYRDARREQILDAARRCFLRAGFHETSMQDLFSEAGLSSGAVYRYFASKDELIVAIAEDNMRDVVAMIHAIATGDHRQSIGQALADVIDLIDSKHSTDGVGGLAIQVWAEALRNPVLAEQFSQLLNQVRGEVATVVRRYQASGDLPTGVPAAALVSVLVGIVPGHLVQLAVLGPGATRGAADALRALWPAESNTAIRKPAKGSNRPARSS
jgi:AcrR family transcriptional regulator